MSVSKAVPLLKGKSSHWMLSEFSKLKKQYRGQPLWVRGYGVCTRGNVTDEGWKKYIEGQKPALAFRFTR